MEAARETIRFYPENPIIHRWLAASVGQLGRVAEAKAAKKSDRDRATLIRHARAFVRRGIVLRTIPICSKVSEKPAGRVK